MYLFLLKSRKKYHFTKLKHLSTSVARKGLLLRNITNFMFDKKRA
jgi:hypothetical protein